MWLFDKVFLGEFRHITNPKHVRFAYILLVGVLT